MEPASYDDEVHSDDQITERLRKLSQADLAKLEASERQGQRRRTVLERMDALRADPPWTGYDDMEVEEINTALKERDGDAARRVLDYERNHKARKTILDFAQRRQGSSGPRKRGSHPEHGSERQPRQRPTAESAKSKPTSRAKPRTRRTSSASARPGAAAKQALRSSGRGSTKASPSRTRSKSASRPSARRASASPRGGGSQAKASSGSRSVPASGRRSRAQARGSSKSRSSRSPSQRRRARPPAPARIRQRVADALRSAGDRTGKAASDARHAVGTAAKEGRDAAGGAASDARHAVGAAARKAKGPALATGVVAAALGGGIALSRDSKVTLRRRKRVLGVPIPRRTMFGKAAKQMSQAVDSAGSAGRQVAELSDGFRELRHILAGAAGGRQVRRRTRGGERALS
jgi:hypothetical protein